MRLTKVHLKNGLQRVLKILFTLIGTAMLAAVIFGVYLIGLFHGYKIGQQESQEQISSIFDSLINKTSPDSLMQTPSKAPTNTPMKPTAIKNWGGPELWEAVNKKRIEYGVNPLNTRSELCTIAAIRLNELLELEKLDNHEGFSNMKERRPDLAWIFDKYGVIAEFLAYGGDSPEETVGLWDNTLGHKKLLIGGEYIWGCVYAQNSFAVAIAAY